MTSAFHAGRQDALMGRDPCIHFDTAENEHQYWLGYTSV